MSMLVIGCAHRSRQTRRCCRAPGGSQSLAETLASLPQELERGGEGALRSGALRIGVVGNVNPNWPRGGEGKWPHLRVARRGGAGGVGRWSPEGGGGVAGDRCQAVV